MGQLAVLIKKPGCHRGEGAPCENSVYRSFQYLSVRKDWSVCQNNWYDDKYFNPLIFLQKIVTDITKVKCLGEAKGNSNPIISFTMIKVHVCVSSTIKNPLTEVD